MPIETNTALPTLPADTQADRPVWQAMWRGLMRRCPCCGSGTMFRGYLKTVDACSSCGEELHHHRADDAPPYFTMLIIGHLIVPVILSVEMAWHPPVGMQIAFWLPMTLILTLALLGVVKGALVALQWSLRMHGFGTGGGDE